MIWIYLNWCPAFYILLFSKRFLHLPKGGQVHANNKDDHQKIYAASHLLFCIRYADRDRIHAHLTVCLAPFKEADKNMYANKRQRKKMLPPN